MFKRMFKIVMAVSIGCLLWSTLAPEAQAKGKPKGHKQVVVHKEVVASPHHAPVVVHRERGRPPMARPMHVVIPRFGFQWVPGHWAWDNSFYRWVWVDGHYLRARHGMRYESGFWAETHRGLRWVDARWVRGR